MNLKVRDAYPFGGGLWEVVFEPTEFEEVLGFNIGECIFVDAKSREEAIEKAKKAVESRLKQVV